jgi:hypothetical protein
MAFIENGSSPEKALLTAPFIVRIISTRHCSGNTIVAPDLNFVVNFACIPTLSEYNARLAAMFVQRWFIVS